MATILIVEDDETQLQLYTRTLQAAGFETYGARDGREGVTTARALQPDAILTDLRMGAFGGTDLLHAIRTDTATASIPVILMTADDAVDLRRIANECLADDFLLKPVAPDDLVAAVRARLRRDQLSRNETERRMERLRRSLLTALPHEFQTPLTAVIGFSDMLRRDAADLAPEEISRMAAAIHTAGLRLQRLAGRYLRYLEIEVLRQDEGRREKVGGQLVESCADVIASAAEAAAARHGRGPDLTFELEDRALVMAEPWLRTAVTEMVDNACKFSAPQTRVLVRAQHAGAGAMAISVRDEGIGMKPEHLRDFAPMIQFDRGSFEQQGAGLGLALVASIADVFGGTLALAAASPGVEAVLSVPVHEARVAEWAD